MLVRNSGVRFHLFDLERPQHNTFVNDFKKIYHWFY
jgi:hypothetical protein